MLEIGTVIGGKYKIQSVLGRGGMSVVYLAVNEKANKPWAVKELVRKEFQELETERKEIALMKRLKNPHLPSIVDVIEQGERLLIVMDYVEGQTLEAMLREQGAQPVERVLDWAGQLCQVLTYLHRQSPPVIYRDMKPSNVMLKPDGTIVLIDLGAAREFRPELSTDTVALGTCGYAAPEQYEEGQSDARTDIYCLGVMLFQLLTGEGPHRLQPLRALRAEIPAGLEAIVERCVQKEKAGRYQSAEELSYALRHYWEQDAAYRMEQKKKLRRFSAVLGLTFLLGVSAAASGAAERQLRRDSYGAWLLAAGNATKKEEELAACEKAISLDPKRADGWMTLLEDGFLDDQLLTAAESERLRGLLIRYEGDGKTWEQLFRENKRGYAEFAYQAGIAYFYKYEENAGKKNARIWLKAAADSGKLNAWQEGRAERLYAIADYYTRIGQADEAGDDLISYGQYWADLSALTRGNLVAEDNARTALVMYQELVGQIITRGAEFQKAGVEREELESALLEIRKRLGTDFGELSDAEQKAIAAEKQELTDMLRKAERLLESVYGGRKSGG